MLSRADCSDISGRAATNDNEIVSHNVSKIESRGE
jgi:hypothetical protein